MTRISRMSMRRRKIAWRRFIKAELAKDLKIEMRRAPIRYDTVGLIRVHACIQKTLERLCDA